MKKIITILAFIVSITSFSQVPQGISYQAIALNSTGNSVASSNVGIRLSVLDNLASGSNLYTETHTKTTNAQGLFNLVIGQGTATTGTFNTINWGTNSKFLKVEIDVAGGTNYVLVGTTQLLSVPYALFAENVGSVAGNTSINDDIITNKSSNFAFDDTIANKMFVFQTSSSTWSSQSYNGNANPTLISSNGSFAFDDTIENKVYVYNGKLGTWLSQNYNSNANPTLQQTNGTFVFDDTISNIVYVFNSNLNIFFSKSYNGNANPTLLLSESNIAFNDSITHTIYVFSAKSGFWYSQNYNSNASPVLIPSNGNFTFDDTISNRVYVFSKKTNSWSFQNYNGNSNPVTVISVTN